jgi:predicted enzyme related to lactoylglutathione lyase
MNMKNGQLCWFEIPAGNLDRAIRFYSTVFSTKFEKKLLLDKEYAVFDKGKQLIGGVIVEKENYSPGSGAILFFYVTDINKVLKTAVELNGKIVINKTFLKQKNSYGDIVIPQNLIDGKMGYYAEMVDSEGNHIGLYSNS